MLSKFRLLQKNVLENLKKKIFEKVNHMAKLDLL
jgi:hypothetical protein